MQQAISQEDLKKALALLVKTDSGFVLSLFEELKIHLPDKHLPKGQKKSKTVKPANESKKVMPAYRQQVKDVYPAAGLTLEAMEELRTLFAGEPPAEQIIEKIQP